MKKYYLILFVTSILLYTHDTGTCETYELFGQSDDGVITLYRDCGYYGCDIFIQIAWSKLASNVESIHIDKKINYYTNKKAKSIWLGSYGKSWAKECIKISYIWTGGGSKPILDTELAYTVKYHERIKHVGDWSNGKKSGNGTEYYNNGNIKFKGIFENGEYYTGTFHYEYGGDYAKYEYGVKTKDTLEERIAREREEREERERQERERLAMEREEEQRRKIETMTTITNQLMNLGNALSGSSSYGYGYGYGSSTSGSGSSYSGGGRTLYVLWIYQDGEWCYIDAKVDDRSQLNPSEYQRQGWKTKITSKYFTDPKVMADWLRSQKQFRH